MGYHFERNESVPEAVRRIAYEEADSAITYLRGKGGTSRDEAIHEARKNIKKLRALVRLVEPELGPSYSDANAGLRAVGRKLSEVRDAGALVTAFDDLRSHEQKKLKDRSLRKVRHGLELQKAHIEQEMNVGEVMQNLADRMEAVRKSIKHWPLGTDGFPAIRDGFEITFRSGKKSLAIVRKQARPEDFHEWRKRVKDHWYHVRLLEKVWEDLLSGYETSLKRVETLLGEEHNLFLLRNTLASKPEAFGEDRTLKPVFSAIEHAEKERRDCALSFGQRIYAQRARRMTREMNDFWQVWQAQPGKCSDG